MVLIGVSSLNDAVRKVRAKVGRGGLGAFIGIYGSWTSGHIAKNCARLIFAQAWNQEKPVNRAPVHETQGYSCRIVHDKACTGSPLFSKSYSCSISDAVGTSPLTFPPPYYFLEQVEQAVLQNHPRTSLAEIENVEVEIEDGHTLFPFTLLEETSSRKYTDHLTVGFNTASERDRFLPTRFELLTKWITVCSRHLLTKESDMWLAWFSLFCEQSARHLRLGKVSHHEPPEWHFFCYSLSFFLYRESNASLKVVLFESVSSMEWTLTDVNLKPSKSVSDLYASLSRSVSRHERPHHPPGARPLW